MNARSAPPCAPISAPAERERSTLPPEPRAPIRDGIRGGEVHVWHGSLHAEPGAVSPAEEARARRMGSARRRHEFLVCRGALRRVLGGALGIEPLAVPILEGAHGKPSLAPGRRPALGFNVSHSGERFVVAAAVGMAPGVDVERVRPHRDLSSLARRFFSPAEQEEVAAARDPLQAFYRVWTRKEAVIKADGRGVAIGLARFDVNAGEPPALLHARWAGAAPDEAAHWSLHPIEAPPGYTAALAVRRPAATVVVRDPAGDRSPVGPQAADDG